MWSKLKRYAELIGVIALAGLPSAGAALAEGEPFPAWADFELEGEVPAHAGQVAKRRFRCLTSYNANGPKRAW
jgi:hypothetical protein